MKLLTKLSAGLLLFAIILVVAPTGASAAWKQNNVGWWYTEGNSYALGWKNIDGTWYYFNSNGYMQTGVDYINGNYYYFYNTGAMAHDVAFNDINIGSDGKITYGKKITSEEVKYIHDISEQKTTNRFTTAEIKLPTDNNSSTKSNDNIDLDGIN
ncbi:hypothetical protein [uncultured Clostridium sp.]|uniref:hypothetical protein n=1 Tax=uncultured Clostridium sp. TaxID=59620 RepID=UPI0028EB2AE3|nr:hypothetical protein [uncultured Clostridium sp.]